MTIPDGIRWQVTIDEDKFEKLKSEESFWALVALSRVVNALRFVHSPLEHSSDDSPAALRVKSNAFLFACALMYEAGSFINQLGKYYAHLPEYSTMVGPVNSQDAKELLENSLGPVRNRAAFHFGRDEIATQLRDLKFSHPVSVSGMGSKTSQVYYDLADLCAMNTFTAASFDSPEQLWQILNPLVRKTSELTFGFVNNAETFIAKVLEQTGWHMIEVRTCP